MYIIYILSINICLCVCVCVIRKIDERRCFEKEKSLKRSIERSVELVFLY